MRILLILFFSGVLGFGQGFQPRQTRSFSGGPKQGIVLPNNPRFEDTFAQDISYQIAPGAPELVTNGGFDSGTTGWTAVFCTLASVTGGQAGNCAEMTRVSDTAQSFSQYFNTVIGEHYRFSIWIKSGTSGNESAYLCARNTSFVNIGIVNFTSSSSWVNYTLDFVATTATSALQLQKQTATAGTMLFDTVSCKLLTGVNNTLSTGRGASQVRTVVDTAGKAKTEGGKLYLTGTGASWTGNRITYNAITRQSGIVCLFNNTVNSIAESGPYITINGNYPNESVANEGSRIITKLRDVPYSYILYPTSYTNFIVACVTRLAGTFNFVKINELHTLIYPYYVVNSATVTPYLMMYSTGTNTLNSIRIPAQRWSPSPVASDGFTRANGALGSTDGLGHPEANGGAGLVWNGGTGWQISGNTLINNPPLGDELLTDPGLEAWTATNDLTSWTETTTGGTVTQTNDVRTGTAGTSAALIVSSSSLTAIDQTITAASRSFVVADIWSKYTTSGTLSVQLGSGFQFIVSPTASWAEYKSLLVAPSLNPSTLFKRSSAISFILDDLSLKQVAFTNLLLLVQLPTPNVIMECKITAPSSQALAAGVALNFDSFSNPQNGTLVWLRNGNVVIQKIVGGTWTDIYNLSTSFTYSAGAKLMVVSDSVAGEIRIFYNNALITSRTDTQDAGIKNNRYFGLFSGNPDQAIDDVVVWARGSEGQYKALDTIQ